ncbi:MAG TPA: hypothetical protein VFE59_10415 [Trebonia sp.]|nr:hypothetical protein [Trebonia sp.]
MRVGAHGGVRHQLIGELLDEAAAAAAEADPVPEPYCPPDYRRAVLRVLVRRSLEQAVASGGAP